MSNSELFYLKWNNFQKNVRRMRDEEDLIDITFACEGKKLGAHKLVLYSCSPYFKDLLKENHSAHPIFFFHDISYDILKAILEYMYLGEVHITNDNLKDFIRVAEALQIRGLSKDTSTTDEAMNESSEQINSEENFGRKRTSTEEHHIQTYTSSGKRLRIISEASLATALNEEDDEMEDEIQPVRTSTKRNESHNLQPKVETLEFLDEAAQHIQQQPAKPPQNITYMNMDSFTEKNNLVTSQPQQPTVTQYVQQASTSQQQQQQSTVDYKSEDEIWVEKAINIDSGTSQTETPDDKKLRNANKNSSSYKANCLTPRSCPVCARVYSNVSNLRQHMRLIHNPHAVICPICQKQFNSDLYLKRHYASIHSINNSGSETEGGDAKPTTTPVNANNSANWNYQSNDGTLLQQ